MEGNAVVLVITSDTPAPAGGLTVNINIGGDPDEFSSTEFSSTDCTGVVCQVVIARPIRPPN